MHVYYKVKVLVENIVTLSFQALDGGLIVIRFTHNFLGFDLFEVLNSLNSGEVYSEVEKITLIVGYKFVQDLEYGNTDN